MTVHTMGSRRRRSVLAAGAAAAGLLATAFVPTSASAAPSADACERRPNLNHRMLLDCVTLDGVREHQEQFQKIADNSDDPLYPGSRAAGTQGYADSVEYVAGLLDDAGYDVTLDEFEFEFVFPAVLHQLTPVDAEYETVAFTGSGAGDVTGPVIPVDLALDVPANSTSGCETTDFDGLDFSGPNDIALMQRGLCAFALKALNAEAAGAEGVVIFNQGNDPSRLGLILGGTLEPEHTEIPVVAASFADGVALAEPGSTARVKADEPETRTDVNVIAELPGKNDDNVVMSGAHLDSVTSGPGINDNGSGSAAILEVALNMANLRPQNTLRFAFWGAEELGLVGSTAYVDELSQAELDRIALYMNYDMVGSPNHVQMTYDADESTFTAPVPVPAGSPAIEDVYESYYTLVGEPYDDAEFSGRSDYQAFINNGIPAGGLFTGAEVVKTAEQEAIWGGSAGDQFDPCYHESCDTFDNVDLDALELNSDLIAFAQLSFAYSTESVNGVPGARMPGRPIQLPEPAGPEGTFEPANT